LVTNKKGNMWSLKNIKKAFIRQFSINKLIMGKAKATVGAGCFLYF
jgi:hypothetical protein